MRKELIKLRKEMENAGVDVYYIPTADFHGSEYIADYFKGREFISGFTGSAGDLVVLRDEAFLWTDGRYFLQAEKELEGSGISLMRAGLEDVPTIEEFLAIKLSPGQIVGFDARVVSGSKFDSLAEHLANSGVFVNYNLDLIDKVWDDRPEIPSGQISQLPLIHTGSSYKEKLAKVISYMMSSEIDNLLLTKLDDIAWLFNLRGEDIDYNPVFYSFALIKSSPVDRLGNTENLKDFHVTLYINNPESAKYLVDSNVSLAEYGEIYNDLQNLPKEQSISVDFDYTSTSLIKAIPRHCKIVTDTSPVSELKSVKNSVEIAATKKCHIEDGLAVTKFIYWLKKSVILERKPLTEIDAANKLEAFRAENSNYLGDSFAAISAYGKNGAIIHYEASESSNANLKADGFYLIDSGGQYKGGTTDITRTIALGNITADMKKHYTAVLKAHIALATAEFTEDTTGSDLDLIARKHVNAIGQNYNHGTGHGVGHMLCVHEGPVSISPREKTGTLYAGMIFSDEPGIYIEEKYGIRIEDELLCKTGDETLLKFESITCCPFEKEAISIDLITKKEISYINDYHKRVYETLGPSLDEPTKLWLWEACKPI